MIAAIAAWWQRHLSRRQSLREARQRERCSYDRHHWRSVSPDRVRCQDPGCGKWWGR